MMRTAVGIDPVEIHLQLDRILRSTIFQKALRSQRFLRYIVERSLPDPPVAIKEYSVAIDVFDRDTSYDPSVDATVRVEASRLRSRLLEYYAGEGASDPLLIDVPKGGYAAAFSLRSVPPEPQPAAALEPAHDPSHPPATVADAPARPRLSLRSVAPLVLLPLVLGVALYAYAWRRPLFNHAASTPIHALAVLPLDNLSGDPSQDYFADGMTDELITMLAKDSTLRITSRTSVMQYKHVHRPLREIARELGVDGVIEGSVERSGNHVHMTIQLIQAPGDSHLWAESYDRDTSEVVDLPATAARAIAQQLHSAVAGTVRARFVRPDAHDAYLHGRYLWYLDNNDKAGEYFHKATELQPDYALGWAGLAIFYGAGTVEGDLDPRSALPRAIEAARKAVELDESLPEAHLALGSATFLADWDWTRSATEIARAIELDPKFAEAYHFRAKMLSAYGQHREAIAAQRVATELDPVARPWALGLSLLVARQTDAALTDVLQRLDSDPSNPSLHWMLARIYRCKGMYPEAVANLETMFTLQNDKASAAAVRAAYTRGGYPAVVRWQIAGLEHRATSRYVSPVELATLYAQIGLRERALALLEQGFQQHAPAILWIDAEPAFDSLHADPRYRAILAGLKFPGTPAP